MVRYFVAATLWAIGFTVAAQQSSAPGASAAAQYDPASIHSSGCKSYTALVNCMACPNGGAGQACQTMTYMCGTGSASGTTTYSNYSYSACSTNDNTQQSNVCALQPESCTQISAKAGACPTGESWVIPPDQKSPFYSHLIAVCAPVCSGGTSLSFTTTPPSCACPGNQVLSGGVCGCPASLPILQGGTCVAATPNCNQTPASGSAVSCAVAGYPTYSGTAYQLVYTTYSGGGSCNQVVTGGYGLGSCTPPACNSGATSTSVSCATAGYPGDTGSGVSLTYTTYTGGGACTPTFAGYGKGTCVAATPNCNQTPASGGAVSCAVAGYPTYSGTAYQLVYTTYSGGGSCNQVVTGGYNIGTCTPPACNSGSTSTSVTCAAAGYSGYSGSGVKYTNTTYTGGGTCTPVVTGYGKGTCTPPTPACNATPSNGSAVSCATAGYSGGTGSGYQIVYTTYSGGGSCTQTPTGGYSQGTCTCSGSAPASTSVSCATHYSGDPVSGTYSSTTYSCSGVTWVGSTTTPNACSCTNGASNAPTCSTCPSGFSMVNGTCSVPASCTAGSVVTKPYCPSGWDTQVTEHPVPPYRTTTTSCPNGSSGAPVVSSVCYSTPDCFPSYASGYYQSIPCN